MFCFIHSCNNKSSVWFIIFMYVGCWIYIYVYSLTHLTNKTVNDLAVFKATEMLGKYLPMTIEMWLIQCVSQFQNDPKHVLFQRIFSMLIVDVYLRWHTYQELLVFPFDSIVVIPHPDVNVSVTFLDLKCVFIVTILCILQIFLRMNHIE